MPHNSGIIYKTDKGEYALAINKEQHPAFEELNKVFIRLYKDIMCTAPLVNNEGRHIETLKSADKLTMIGFSD